MVQFIASLKIGKPIKIGDEGDAEITFITSADELAEVLKLTLHRKQAFKVIIMPVDKVSKDES